MAPGNPTQLERLATLEEQVKGLRIDLREDIAGLKASMTETLEEIREEFMRHVANEVKSNTQRLNRVEMVAVLAVGIAIGSGLLGLGPILGLWK
jgi:hypothetical protein